jgi:hypothetical protein
MPGHLLGMTLRRRFTNATFFVGRVVVTLRHGVHLRESRNTNVRRVGHCATRPATPTPCHVHVKLEDESLAANLTAKRADSRRRKWAQPSSIN